MSTKPHLRFSFLLLSAVIFLSACDKNDNPKKYEERVVVANRAAGSISFIDASSDQIITTLAIPGSEPMYVVYVPSKDKLYVGDRAGKKIHIVNPQTKTIENAITVGNGVFHMWADGQGKQLWVSNDIDSSMSVIDLNKNIVIQTIKIGMKPHDVFLTNDATKAYISSLNADAAIPDKVLLYSTTNFSKIKEMSVGKDPHLFHLSNSNKLFVPCQSGQLYTLNGNDLSVLSNIQLPGAHGIFPSPNQHYVFITGINVARLYAINTSNSTQIGEPVITATPTPHNIVVTHAGNKLFVTHSGATANTVSTWSISTNGITAGATITVGTNPFGIAYYKRELKNAGQK